MERTYIKYLIRETLEDLEQEKIEETIEKEKELKRKKETILFESHTEMRDYFIDLLSAELSEKDYVVLERNTFIFLLNKHTKYKYANLSYYEERNRSHYSIETLYSNLFEYLPNTISILSRAVHLKSIVYLTDNEKEVLSAIKYNNSNMEILEKKYEESLSKIEYWKNRNKKLKTQLDILNQEVLSSPTKVKTYKEV